MNARREFFIFAHIMKTAGSSFSHVLHRNFGPAFIAEYGLLNNYQYSADQVSEIIEGYPYLRCVASHRFSLDLPWSMPGVDLRAITFVREPAARLVSFYFFRRHINISDFNPLARRVSLQDWVRWAMENDPFVAVDHQAKFLFGRDSGNSVELARELAGNRRLLLFPSERFNEALLVLARLFPAWFQNFRFERQMVSIKDQPVPGDLLEEIRGRQTLDPALHEFAESELDRLIANCFPDRGEFEAQLGKFNAQ